MAKAKGGGRKGLSKQPNYEVAMRIARIVNEMPSHSLGWPLSEIADYLRVSERTVRRYAKALSEEFTTADGSPLFELAWRGDRLRLIKNSPSRSSLSESVYHLISVYLSLELFRMLGENVLALSVEDVFDRTLSRLTTQERDLLVDLDRKFFTAAWAPKDYSAHVDILEDAIKAVVYQVRVRMIYKSSGSDPRELLIEPYTLLHHKGGFYLVGRASGKRLPVYFNVERIQELELIGEKFNYPRDYHPRQMIDGAFGIWSGPARTFRLKFPASLADYICSRRWHSSQKIKRNPDGSVVLTLRVADSEEVASWIRSFGEGVEVLKGADKI